MSARLLFLQVSMTKNLGCIPSSERCLTRRCAGFVKFPMGAAVVLENVGAGLALSKPVQILSFASGGRKASRQAPYRGGAVARIECPLSSLLGWAVGICFPAARFASGVVLSDSQPFVGLLAAFTGPNLIARTKFPKRTIGNNGRCSAQGVIAASGAGLTGCLCRFLLGVFKSCNTGFQFFNAFWRLGQRFPNWCFVKDFQNVRY